MPSAHTSSHPSAWAHEGQSRPPCGKRPGCCDQGLILPWRTGSSCCCAFANAARAASGARSLTPMKSSVLSPGSCAVQSWPLDQLLLVRGGLLSEEPVGLFCVSWPLPTGLQPLSSHAKQDRGLQAPPEQASDHTARYGEDRELPLPGPDPGSVLPSLLSHRGRLGQAGPGALSGQGVAVGARLYGEAWAEPWGCFCRPLLCCLDPQVSGSPRAAGLPIRAPLRVSQEDPDEHSPEQAATGRA